MKKQVSIHDQEMLQSQTTDQPRGNSRMRHRTLTATRQQEHN